jgi:hypothetical protein
MRKPGTRKDLSGSEININQTSRHIGPIVKAIAEGCETAQLHKPQFSLGLGPDTEFEPEARIRRVEYRVHGKEGIIRLHKPAPNHASDEWRRFTEACKRATEMDTAAQQHG